MNLKRQFSDVSPAEQDLIDAGILNPRQDCICDPAREITCLEHRESEVEYDDRPRCRLCQVRSDTLVSDDNGLKWCPPEDSPFCTARARRRLGVTESQVDLMFLLEVGAVERRSLAPDSNCRRCGTPIHWVTTRANGRKTPLECPPLSADDVARIPSEEVLFTMVRIRLKSAAAVTAAMRKDGRLDEFPLYRCHLEKCGRRRWA
jgi:hypothetical protein